MSVSTLHDAEPNREYGFYDSDTGPHPIWWYTFGGLVNFRTAQDALRAAAKSTWGTPVIVSRVVGESEWREEF